MNSVPERVTGFLLCVAALGSNHMAEAAGISQAFAVLEVARAAGDINPRSVGLDVFR